MTDQIKETDESGRAGPRCEQRLVRRPFRALGRDLYFDLKCTCPSPLFEKSEIAHLMKHTIKLTGYADDNFFDRVNAATRESFQTRTPNNDWRT